MIWPDTGTKTSGLRYGLGLPNPTYRSEVRGQRPVKSARKSEIENFDSDPGTKHFQNATHIRKYMY